MNKNAAWAVGRTEAQIVGPCDPFYASLNLTAAMDTIVAEVCHKMGIRAAIPYDWNWVAEA